MAEADMARADTRAASPRPAEAQLCRLQPSYFGQVYDEPTGLYNWAPALMGHLAF
jgi:hypothetical protein